MRLDFIQQQKFAPALQLSAKILQMNNVELKEYLSEFVVTNVMAELNSEPVEDFLQPQDIEPKQSSQDDHDVESDDIPWQQQSDLEPWQYLRRAEVNGNSAIDFLPTETSIGKTLKDELYSQILQIPFDIVQDRIIDYIIESLDEHGFFNESPADVAALLNTDDTIVKNCLNLIKSLEPAGVGARNIEECLIIQLERMSQKDDIAREIITNHLDKVAKAQFSIISKILHVSKSRVIEACDKIKQFSPYPANGYSTSKSTNYIIPDILVVSDGNQLVPVINSYCLPRIQVNTFYSDLCQSLSDKSTQKYVTRQLAEVSNVIKFVQKRGDTINRVMNYIIEKQKDYFIHGSSHLVTMRIKEVAEELGLHESTISRAIQGKYFECDRGVFPLRSLFSYAVKDVNSDDDISRNQILQRIKKIVSSETGISPLSDQQICDCLRADGIDISRRTVTKYRLELDIPNAFLRLNSKANAI